MHLPNSWRSCRLKGTCGPAQRSAGAGRRTESAIGRRKPDGAVCMRIFRRGPCPPRPVPSVAQGDGGRAPAELSCASERRSSGGSTPNVSLRRDGRHRPRRGGRGRGVQEFSITYREATLRRLVGEGGPVDGRMRGGSSRRERAGAAAGSPPMTAVPWSDLRPCRSPLLVRVRSIRMR